MNSIRTSVPLICTGRGTGRPALHSSPRALNSAKAHWLEIICLPNSVRRAMARISRLRRTRRPSRYPASRWNIRWSESRNRLAAMYELLPALSAWSSASALSALSAAWPTGTQRRTTWTSASLPDLMMPRSSSTAPRSVITQAGRGFGPCWARSQLDQDPAANDVDVGLLAGLDDAQILVNCPEIGDHPGGTWVRAMLGAIPAGPGLALGWAVGGAVDGKHAVAELSRELGSLFVRQTG